MIELPIKAVLGYLLGSIVGSLLLGKLRGIDIRLLGSGNAGGTNALRTQGKWFAFWVLVIDIGKGWVATGLLAGALIPNIPSAPADWRVWAVAACGIAVMLGHVYPLWHGFRGGKGVATLVGAVLGAAPTLLVPMLMIWLVAVIIFGFVGLASLLGAFTFAAAAATSSGPSRLPLLTFAVLSAVLIAYTHRANVIRMLTGTEPRARRLWLFGTGRTRS